jgi:aspartyl aminopeptidase
MADVKELKEKLFYNNENGVKKVSDEELKKADEFAEGYKKFLDEAKTEREAVTETIEMAKNAGFTEYEKGKKYVAGDRYYINNHNKSAIFVVIGEKDASNGMRIGAAHIDSPRLDLKPQPLYEEIELAMLKTHYYGGIRKYQWTAIPLALHGVFVKKDGTTVTVNVGEDENDPVFVVNDLLPHLSGEQNKRSLADGIRGEELNVLIGSRPFKADEGSELVKLNILNILFEKYGVTEGDFLSAELEIVPAFKARDIGFDRSLIGAYGHDDRVCAYPSLKALFDIKVPYKTAVCVLADKEEIGSTGNTGLSSDLLKHVLGDIARMQGVEPEDAFRASECLSADVNAAVDPTFQDVFERRNASFVNYGVVITKYTGAGGKSRSNDASAEYMAKIRNMLDSANIIWQAGELGKVDAGGGGTVAMFVAALGIDTVDLGVPVLSMHAPYETVSKLDVYMTYRAMGEFFK